MDKMNSTSMDVVKEKNVEQIKELFPNVITEGKIDFDVLKEMLGDEIEERKEKYQFTWPGKAESIKIAQTPSSSTLRPCKEKSKDWDTTENLYIEGDNLEVLKQLQKTYYGKIKMIYIDPPYNTGNDFVYKDDFKNSLEAYKNQTNQANKSNPETAGRFHTDWLNMMYPRLLLARNLLRDDGVVFISINDNEMTNLIKMCDEIFGESNRISTFVWKNKYGPGAFTKGVASLHEYVICYGKTTPSNIESELSDQEQEKYKGIDEKYPIRGGYITQPLATLSKDDRPNLVYPLLHNGVEIWPNKQWIWSKERLYDAYNKNELVINEKEGKYSVRFKQYLKDENGQLRKGKPLSLITSCFNQDGTKEIEELLGRGVFDFPKPTRLIKDLLSLRINEKDENDFIVIDFFSGSATTADSVMQLNALDSGKRKYILVQIPEKCPEGSVSSKNGYKDICEIAQKRINLSGEKIKNEWLNNHKGEGLFSDDNIEFPVDIGFKVFKLDSTNINPWDNEKEYDEDSLMSTATVFKIDRSKEDVLYEIMLKYGIFDQPVTEIDINDKKMFRVGKRHMIVCLEDNIDENDIKAIGELTPRVVVFKEDGFIDDNAKINAEYNLKKSGVEDVKCV